MARTEFKADVLIASGVPKLPETYSGWKRAEGAVFQPNAPSCVGAVVMPTPRHETVDEIPVTESPGVCCVCGADGYLKNGKWGPYKYALKVGRDREKGYDVYQIWYCEECDRYEKYLEKTNQGVGMGAVTSNGWGLFFSIFFFPLLPFYLWKAMQYDRDQRKKRDSKYIRVYNGSGAYGNRMTVFPE